MTCIESSSVIIVNVIACSCFSDTEHTHTAVFRCTDLLNMCSYGESPLALLWALKGLKGFKCQCSASNGVSMRAVSDGSGTGSAWIMLLVPGP